MIQNLVHILMVIAIANPLCCCTAELFAMDEAMPMPASACCGGDSSHHEDAPSQSQHDTDKCPHQSTKEFQSLSSAQQDVKVAQADLGLLPLFVLLFEAYELNPHLVPVVRISDVSTSLAVPPELSQVYCVYRI